MFVYRLDQHFSFFVSINDFIWRNNDYHDLFVDMHTHGYLLLRCDFNMLEITQNTTLIVILIGGYIFFSIWYDQAIFGSVKYKIWYIFFKSASECC